MGVTPWEPVFSIKANGEDITKAIRANLKKLTITDEAGVQSDSLQIDLADSGIAMPPTGAELQVWLGYRGAARYMGLYVVDEIVITGPPNTMGIKALAAPFEKSATYGALQDQKSRSWEPGTVGYLVTTIAQEHGLTPAVSASLASVQLGHLDQTNESDMNLLTRVARDVDAIAKAGGGRLLFVPQGEGMTASGKSLPTVAVTRVDLSTWRASISNRANYGQVVAVWRDKDAAADREVVVGSEKPSFRLRHTYPSEDAATRAAQGRLNAFKRGTGTLSVTMPGRTDIIAESRLLVSGVRSGVDGEWSVTRATHTLADKLTTAIEAEVPKR